MNPFSSMRNDIYSHIFRTNNVVYKLIFLNVIIFIVVGLLEVIFILFKLNYDNFQQFVWNNLAISSDPLTVLKKPWTLISYMFMHSGFFHILFNMLMLFWFGKIFRDFLGDRRLLAVYLAGGLAGAILFLLAYQTIPLLNSSQISAGMVGASASVVAVIVAAATYVPNYSVFLLFLGQIKLKYLAVFLVIIDVLSLKEGNTGGHFAHLGGAVFGFIYSRQLVKGHDIAAWISLIIDFFENIFRKENFRSKSKFKVYSGSPNYGNNMKKKNDTGNIQKEIDKILDKIAQSGYESLTEEEKNILFNASKRSR